METLFRFLEKIEDSPTGCWEWTAAKNRKGYGQFRVKGVLWIATRWAYTYLKGEHPGDKQVCHTCDNPSCVNPEHLWLGDNKENSLDMLKKKRSHNQLKTHCPAGHEYTPENTYSPPNIVTGLLIERQCRICKRNLQRIRRELHGRQRK